MVRSIWTGNLAFPVQNFNWNKPWSQISDWESVKNPNPPIWHRIAHDPQVEEPNDYLISIQVSGELIQKLAAQPAEFNGVAALWAPQCWRYAENPGNFRPGKSVVFCFMCRWATFIGTNRSPSPRLYWGCIHFLDSWKNLTYTGLKIQDGDSESCRMHCSVWIYW